MEEYENLQFENQQLHVYTDDLETKLRNIRLFLQQGITLHTNLVKLKNTPETRKFLEFLQDAISIVQETQLPVAKSAIHLPQLKSLKDLPKSPRSKKPSPRRVKELMDEDFNFKINIRRHK